MPPLVRWYLGLSVVCYVLMPFIDDWIPEEGLI